MLCQVTTITAANKSPSMRSVNKYLTSKHMEIIRCSFTNNIDQEISKLFLFYFPPLPPSPPHLQVLQEKFTEFASETGSVGQERVTAVNQMVDELIDYGHSEAATIAEWKDGVNEAWADLLELMETRAQMLAASHQLHKFFSDCREVIYLRNTVEAQDIKIQCNTTYTIHKAHYVLVFTDF